MRQQNQQQNLQRATTDGEAEALAAVARMEAEEAQKRVCIR